jgi:ankyrin repeat protein
MAMDDHRYYTCYESMAKTFSNAATQSCAERDYFTRGTLRLTTERLETLLMHSSVNINEVDWKGRTALHLATYLCDIQAVELLLGASASSEVRDYAGKSPLQVAAALGTALLASVRLDLEQRNQLNFGNITLHNMFFQGHAHIVELLLDAGADMEAPNDIGKTSLRHVVIRNNVEVLKVLHERGAAFTMVDNIGCIAFHDAILVNAHECLDIILKLRVRVDQLYLTTGQTALHLLAENAYLFTLKIFMGGAQTGLGELDIAARDGKGLTALKYLNLRHDDDSEFLNLFQLLLKRIEAIHSESRRLPLSASLGPLDCVDQLFEDDEDDDFTDAPENQIQD